MRALALTALLFLSAGAAESAKKKPPAAEAWPRILKVARDRPFVAGGVRYVVQTVQSWKALPKAFGYEVPPPGSMFLIVNYTVESMSSDPVTALANYFFVRDGRGRRFTPSDTAQIALAFGHVAPGNEVELRPTMVLQPGVRRLLLTGFQVPEDLAEVGATLYFPTSGAFDFVEVWPSGLPR